MRKLILTTLAAAVLAVPAALQAQVVNVTATVDKFMTSAWKQDLKFGTLSRTLANTVNASDVTNGGQVQVAYNTPLTISLPNSGTITSAGGGTLNVSYTCATVATDAAYAIGANLWSGTGSDCSGGVNIGAPTTVAYLLVGVGGTITAAQAAAAPAGNYSGTITVTVTD